MKSKAAKHHRERKNPGMRDKFAKLRHERNAKRSKQVWVSDVCPAVLLSGAIGSAPGHWEREAA